MIPAEEENFPRGGTRVNLKRHKQDDNLFSIAKPPKAKKSKKVKKPQKNILTEDAFQSSLQVQGTLSLSKIQEGMVILACIRKVKNISLEVELPGLIFGTVNIVNISDPFTKYLNKKLEESDDESEITLKKIFTIGQFVVVKIIGIKYNEKGAQVECTLNPKDINNEKLHSSFKKGMLIWASVQSVLDHGYEINVGVKNCRVFLPTKNVDEDKSFAIGEPLWCVIHKSESTNVVTTLRVSSKTQHIKSSVIEEIDGLQDIAPGMQVEIVTEKITTHSIQGKFLKDYFGYIHETQLKYPLKKPEDYKEGKLLSAFVLYIEPATKITYLSLRGVDPSSEPSHAVGETVSAKVISKTTNGVYLSLPDNEKCFVTNKRLINSLSKKANEEVTKKLLSKFSVGTKHICRIVDYNHMSKMYVCAVEAPIVKEKVFNSSDVKIGQKHTVTVERIKSDGLIVSLGHTKGFVPNFHVSEVKVSENIKKKFKEGSQVDARVLEINDGNIIFTLKAGLVKSDNCLTDIEQIKRGDQYSGVVVEAKASGALVLFYGNIKGWLGRKYIGSDEDENFDPTEYFNRGQVINPWVLRVDDEKIVLTLRDPSQYKYVNNVKIGQRMFGTVSKIYEDKIAVKMKGRIFGEVPVNHLSVTVSLCSTFLKTYNVGDEINNLLCINNTNDPIILSRREGLFFDRNESFKIKNFRSLQPGNLVRCSYLSDCETGIYVLPLILDYTKKVLIPNEDIVNAGESLPKFEHHQSIVAKIMNITRKPRRIRFTIKVKEIFDDRVESAVSFFSQHLADIKYLREFGFQNKWELCQYYPGERVTCRIEQLGDEGGCLVTLPNKIKGLVAPHLCPEKINPGQSLEGVFLAQDFKDSYAEVCFRKDISQKINKMQDGLIKTSSLSSCIAENVVIKNDYVLGVLKQDDCKRQLVYLPLYLHENDFTGCRRYYENNKFKICICGKVGPYLIGMSKKLFLTLDKHTQKFNKKFLHDNKNASTNEDKQLVKFAQSSIELTENSNDEDTEVHIEEEEKDDEAESDVEMETDNVEEELDNDVEMETDDDDDEIDEIESGQEIKQKAKKVSASKRKDDEPSKNITFGDQTVKSFSSSDSITGPLPVLPGVSSFFKPDAKADNESSSDEEEKVETIKKKKKLTPAERAELARQEEEKISKIERELADQTKAPESAEQFDRLLLANPNSSELWTQYMSFQIAMTEFEKARTVAKRALESISMTLTEERLNIWIALLNLENMVGTKESFDKSFEDAVKYNDSLQVYLKGIQILAEAGKFNDMEDKIRKVRNKHKQDPTMWLEVAKVYYQINKFKEARNMKDASLKSIQDMKTQLNIIIRFAIMEFKYGEEDQGAAIFETILSSDPRKVNVWTTYVDQLVKKDRIEQARKVLERSVCQRLPLKSMKSLFLKFRTFEEQHGTPDTVEAVKEKAKEYVTKNIDK